MILFNHVPLESIYEYPPGSGQILYRFADSLEGFWGADTSGNNLRRLYGQALGDPALSRDGSYLFYEGGGQIRRIQLMADSLVLGSDQALSMSVLGVFGPSLSWGGDRMLCYVTGGPNAGVYITSSTGGQAQRVTGSSGWTFPDWLPGDSNFVFVGYWQRLVGIGVSDTNGQSVRELQSEAIYPRCSPDGQHVAFLSHPSSGGLPQIWVVRPDGSQLRQITVEGSMEGFSWSPDGRQIAYVRYDPTDFTYINGTIWTVDISTNQKKQVTFNLQP